MILRFSLLHLLFYRVFLYSIAIFILQKVKLLCVCSFSCVIQIVALVTNDARRSDIPRLLMEYFTLLKKYVCVKVAISQACHI